MDPKQVVSSDPQPRQKLAASASAKAPPCTLIIFGAHGDLTKRLLTPALYNLVGAGLLDDGFKVIGVDRVDGSDESWRDELGQTMQEFTKDPDAEFYTPEINQDWWKSLSGRMQYYKADFTDIGQLEGLKAHVSGNVLFYMAVASRFFATVVENIGKAGMTKEEEGAFRRVVVEKPFGSDLVSARELNSRLLAVLDETQIYRIDHFLGKETVQNILAMRFGNGIFEPLWRREYVDHVQITACETVGVEGARRVLRADRRAARHDPEPPVPAAVDGGDGAAELVFGREPCGRPRTKLFEAVQPSCGRRTRSAASIPPAACRAARCRPIATARAWRTTASPRPTWR